MTVPVEEELHQTESVCPEEEPFCRICHEGPSQEDLLTPCDCSGTLATVHRSCLEHWLNTSHSKHCELCRHKFHLERLPKLSVSEWLSAASTQHQRRALCLDAVCFLFFTPLAGLLWFLWLPGAIRLYRSHGEQVIVLVPMLTLLLVYVFWAAITVRYHAHLFRTQRVRLQVPASKQSAHHPHAPSPDSLSRAANTETMV